MADLNNPTSLNLGRVGLGVPVIHDSSRPARQENTAIDGLLAIGNTIAGGLVKEQKRKEFYEGQNRVMQASLDGTQQEELKNILDEQPWYMQLMGNGAVAEGAVEMASRVGAGRVFDGHLARLAGGQDAEVAPDVYKQQVQEQLRAQLTGDERVDSVFMPQMISKAQGLIATHLQKNFEFMAKSTMQGSTEETYNALSTLDVVMEGEQGAGAAFNSDTPMTTTVLKAYDHVVVSLDPTKRPMNVSADGWAKSKVILAVAALEKGNTVVMQAMHDSGLLETLSAEDRVRIDDAAAKGKKESDGNKQLQFLPQEAELATMVYKAKTDKDIAAIYEKARSIAAQYHAAKITPPDKFKDSAAIKEYVFRGIGEKNQYEEREENKRQRLLEQASEHAMRLAETAQEKAAAAGQAHALNSAMLTNAIGGWPHNPIRVAQADGSSVLYQPTAQERVAAYTEYKGLLLGMSPADRELALHKRGVKSLEDLAFRFDVVDDAVAGRLTQVLKARAGQPKPDAASLEAMSQVKALLDVGGVEYAKAHVDAGVRDRVALMSKAIMQTNDPGIAWARSFGRPDSGPTKIDTGELSKKLGMGAVKKAIDGYGGLSAQARGIVYEAALSAMESGQAKNTAEGLELGVLELQGRTEVVGEHKFLNVPHERTVAGRTGIRQPEVLAAAVDFYAKRSSGQPAYTLQYLDSTREHLVIPINADGKELWSLGKPLDYNALRDSVTNPNSAQELHRRVIRSAIDTARDDFPVDVGGAAGIAQY